MTGKTNRRILNKILFLIINGGSAARTSRFSILMLFYFGQQCVGLLGALHSDQNLHWFRFRFRCRNANGAQIVFAHPLEWDRRKQDVEQNIAQIGVGAHEQLLLATDFLYVQRACAAAYEFVASFGENFASNRIQTIALDDRCEFNFRRLIFVGIFAALAVQFFGRSVRFGRFLLGRLGKTEKSGTGRRCAAAEH